MKSWKKIWFDELDKITPELSDEVKNAPIPAQTVDSVANQGGVAVASRNNNRNLWIVLASVLLCIAIIVTIVLVTPKSGVRLFTVEINPAVSFAVDNRGNVTNVIAVNEDADVILSMQDVRNNIVGKDINQAVKYYTDCAARLGYLNFDKVGSAVRVSGCEKNTERLLEGISASLQDYFTSKGVYAVVVADIVSVEEYCERSGMDKTKSFKDLEKAVKDSQTLVSQRNAQSMTKEQLQSSYKKLVGDYDEFMLSHIRENIDRIIQNATAVSKLYELNGNIEESEDNPSTLLKDYWSVKTFYPDTSQYSVEFSALMSQMEAELASYKQQYGAEFANKWELFAANTKYSQLPVPLEELKVWLDSITENIVGMFSDILSDIMEIAGVLDETIGELMKLPATVEEYVAKTAGALQRNFERRLAEYNEIYVKAREEISAGDYSEFINGIISQYGSLNEYWQVTH